MLRVKGQEKVRGMQPSRHLKLVGACAIFDIVSKPEYEGQYWPSQMS